MLKSKFKDTIHYYSYDENCNMLEWKAVESLSGKIVNTESYSYSGRVPVKFTYFTPFGRKQETASYQYFQQNDGSVFQYWKGSQSSSLKQYNKSGLLVWSDSSEQSSFFSFVSGSGVTYSNAKNFGSKQIIPTGGERVFYDSEGRVSYRENFNTPNGSYLGMVNYSYDNNGFLSQEFNTASSNTGFYRSAKYDSYKLDHYQNWLERSVELKNEKNEKTSGFQSRSISYY